jgi:hypothetical protein
MSKKSKPAPTPEVAATPATPPTKVTVKPVLIKVLKSDAKFRGARDAWYAELKAHDGKTLKEYVDACTAKPPSLPKSLKAEAVSGWVSYFKRTGILELVEAPAKAE